MIDEGGAGGRTSVGESVGEAMWIIAVEKSMITESEVFLCFVFENDVGFIALILNDVLTRDFGRGGQCTVSLGYLATGQKYWESSINGIKKRGGWVSLGYR